MDVAIFSDDPAFLDLLEKLTEETGCRALPQANDGSGSSVHEPVPSILIVDATAAGAELAQTIAGLRERYPHGSAYLLAVLETSEKTTDFMNALEGGADAAVPWRSAPELLRAQIRAGIALMDGVTGGSVPDGDPNQTRHRLETMQALMLQSEKMAAIGQLAAGVAHEINNPTGYVANNLTALEKYQADLGSLIEKYRNTLTQLSQMACHAPVDESLNAGLTEIQSFEKEIDIDFLLTDIADLIADCKEGTRRIKKIVTDLKAFAHPGDETMLNTDINKSLASTLNLASNELKYKAVVKTDFGKIPYIKAIPQQLNQVFMNLLVNAAQAMDEKGEIEVSTRQADDCVEIAIRDTGCGIPEAQLEKIFDPFFTTKPVGKGTGLGMHIVQDIVRKHNGTIHVQSKVGEGTTFTVRLPA